MPSGPVIEDIRDAMRWVDGHADVWRLFADGSLFRRCVTALEPYRQDGVTHVAGIEAALLFVVLSERVVSVSRDARSSHEAGAWPAESIGRHSAKTESGAKSRRSRVSATALVMALPRPLRR